MPLLKGKENIGHNVNEMKKSGHPVKQAVTAALHTALDNDDGEEGTINSKLTRQAQHKGVIVSHDAPEMHSTTAMSVADINKKNESYWNGENGNVGPAPANEASSPKLGGGKVAVYNPHAQDEVAPTQSLPPDTRSDNLLERPHGGIPGTEDEVSARGIAHAVRTGVEVGHAVGKGLAEGKVVDDWENETGRKILRGALKPSTSLNSPLYKTKEKPKRELPSGKGQVSAAVRNAAKAHPEYMKDDLAEGTEAMVGEGSDHWYHHSTRGENPRMDIHEGAGVHGGSFKTVGPKSKQDSDPAHGNQKPGSKAEKKEANLRERMAEKTYK